MPALIQDDVEFRDRLVDHLFAFMKMFNGIEARSIVSSSILLYGRGNDNPIINNKVRQETIPIWIRSLTNKLRVENVNVCIPLNREFMTDTKNGNSIFYE